MFSNINLENINLKNSFTWFQQNYIEHKYNICKSLSYFNQILKIHSYKTLFLNKKIFPTAPHTTPRKEIQSMFHDNSGWNTLKVLNSLHTNIPISITIPVDRHNYQSSGSLDNISNTSNSTLNSSNSTLNSSIGDLLSNIDSTSPYLCSKNFSSFNSVDTF